MHMKAHELNTILNDVSHQLKRDNPALEFKPEATETELSLLVTYPDGGKSRFHLNITEKDEVIPQPAFHTTTEEGNDAGEINDRELNDKWVAMLKERIQKTGFDYFYDEIGGEG